MFCLLLCGIIVVSFSSGSISRIFLLPEEASGDSKKTFRNSFFKTSSVPERAEHLFAEGSWVLLERHFLDPWYSRDGTIFSGSQKTSCAEFLFFLPWKPADAMFVASLDGQVCVLFGAGRETHN